MINATTRGDTVYAQLGITGKRYGDRPFLHVPWQAAKGYSNAAINYTYSAMQASVAEVQRQYARAGYGAGHRVALMLENRPVFFIHFFALNGLGVCVIPVNTDLICRELAYLIDYSDVSLVITLSDYREQANNAKADIDRRVCVLSIDDFNKLPEAPDPVRTAVRSGTGADAAVVYTSGTTGKPKGCVLSNEYFLCVGQWYLNIGGYCTMEPGLERLITPLPVFHTNALVWSLMAMLMSGGCLIQLDRFHSSSWWESASDSAATIMHYLGVMPAMLLNMPETAHDLQRQIKFALGAGVEPDLHARFEQRFGFPLIEGWSMTETGAGVCFMSAKEPRYVGHRCIGMAQEEMEYRIVDEHKQDTFPGQSGELLVRRKGDRPAYGFFTEYYKDPEATKEAWCDAWFHTGDIVKKGDDNVLYFVERRKNIIRRSGENIAAAEVENILIDHPCVANCAVAPVPDAIRGEEVAACVVLNKGYPGDEKRAILLVTHCLEKLSYYKVPGYIIFMTTLPLTATQKVKHGKLCQLCLELMNTVQCIDCRSLKKKK